MNNNASIKKNNELKVLIFITLIIILGVILGSTYAFFNYTRTGNPDVLNTGYIDFDFNGGSEIEKGNAFPIEETDVDNTIVKTFSLTSHTTFTDGIVYRIYAVYGDNVSGKTRLRDDVVSFEFIPPEDANGFTTEINNYSSPKSPSFTNGKALISTGVIKNTSNLTTKNYTLKLWIDSRKINISSTTKRATNAEGNPSLADATTGTTTATRYMRNDTTEPTTVTLYPAITSQQGKIIYTTNEFSNSYYSFKILVEAEDYDGETVYLDANGGNVSTTMLKVTPGETYPVLPTPTRAGYTFLGWNGRNYYNYEDTTTVTNGLTVNGNGWITLNTSNGAHFYNYYTKNLDIIENKQYMVVLEVSNVTNNTGRFWVTSISASTGQFPNKIYDFDSSYVNSVQIDRLVSRSGVTGNVGLRTYYENTNYATDEGIVFRISVLDDDLTITADNFVYEPFYVNNTVTVTQEKDHVLKAIWQKNS